MKKNNCLQLLILLKRVGIDFKDLEIDKEVLFNIPDEIIEELLLLTNKQEILYALNAINYWNSYENIKDNLEYQKQSIKSLTLYTNEFQIPYIYNIIINEDAIKARITLLGTKIITKTKEIYQAEYASKILCDASAIKAEIALDGAALISATEKEFQAKYSYDVLCNNNTIKARLGILAAKAISESKTEFQAKYASIVLCDKNVIKTNLDLKGAYSINTYCKNEEQASSICKILRLLSFLRVDSGDIQEVLMRKINKIEEQNISEENKELTINNMTVNDTINIVLSSNENNISSETIKQYIKNK